MHLNQAVIIPYVGYEVPVALFNDQIVLTGTAGNVPLIFHHDRDKVLCAVLLDLLTPSFQLGGWGWWVFLNMLVTPPVCQEVEI